jgi:hypothetical protein
MAGTDALGDSRGDLHMLEPLLGSLDDCLTTAWARARRPEALPWKFPMLSALKASLRHGRLSTFIDLTCCCCARTKRAHRAG